MGRARISAFVAVALVALAVTSRAQPTARMVLVPGNSEPTARRVRAEAAHVGLFVEEVPREHLPLGDAELASEHDAVAVIRLVSEKRVTVYVSAIREHGAEARVFSESSVEGDSLALRAVEYVRARLIELNVLSPDRGPDPSTKKPPSADSGTSDSPPPPTTPEADEFVPATSAKDDRAARLWLTTGVGGISSAGRMGSTVDAALGFRVEPSARFGVAVQALLALTSSSLSGAEGSADVSATSFCGQIGYSPFDLGAGWSFETGPGAAVLLLTMHADAAPPFQGKDDRILSGLYFLHLSTAWSAAPWFRLRAALLGGTSAPRPVVKFDGREVGTWGRPFGSATLTAEFGLALSTGEATR